MNRIAALRVRLRRLAAVGLSAGLSFVGVQCIGDLANVLNPPPAAVQYRFDAGPDSIPIDVGATVTIPAELRVGTELAVQSFRSRVEVIRGTAADIELDSASLSARALKWGRWVLKVSAASSVLPADTLPWDTIVVRARVPRVIVEPATLRDTLLTSHQRVGQLGAYGATADGQRIENTAIAWRISGAAGPVTLVNPTGQVRAGTSDGSATLEAFVNDSGFSTAVMRQTVRVHQAPWTVAVTPTTRTLRAAGQSITLAAEVKDSLGAVMPAASVQWSSGAPTIATVVAGTGVVTAAADGAAVITASAPDTVRGGARQQTAQITVERARLGVVGSAAVSGTVAAQLEAPLVVQLVRPADGSAVAEGDIPIVFTTTGGATFVRNGLAADTALTDAQGRASALLRLGTVATEYAVTVTGPGLAGNPVGFVATARVAAAGALAFTSLPSGREAGDTLSVGVTVTDVYGNTVSSYANPVRLALASGPAGARIAAGDTVAVPVGGIARFSGLRLERAGAGYAFQAASARAEGDTIGATSVSFAIAAGPAVQLAFTTVPTAAPEGDSLGVAVTAQDVFDNTATSYGGPVTVTLGANPGSATLGGTLTRDALFGVAPFADLNLDKVGTGYTLVASSGALAGATSVPFDVTPAPAKRLAFTVAPASAVAGTTFSVTVNAYNRYDTLATSFADSVTLALGGGPTGAALLGTTRQKATSGVATFPGLALRTVGENYTLAASAAGLTGATTAAFAVSPAAAAALVGVSGDLQTDSAGVTLPAPFVVEVRDAYGNTVADQPVVFTVAAGGGKLSGQDSVVVPTDAQGRSSVTLALGTTRDTNRVTASIAGVGAPVTFRAFALTRVAAVSLSPHTATLYSLPDSVRLAATARDAAGVAISGVAFIWESTNASVATVSAAGMVTAHAGGTAYVRATTAGVSDSALITVQAATDFSCTSSGGTTHGGTVSASETWTKAGSPHFVTANLTAQSAAVLTIDPGALVCLSSGVRMTFQTGGRLVARGAVAPNAISFRATNAAQPWGGMTFSGAPGDSSYLVNVVIENTTGGTYSNLAAVRSQDAHFLVLDSTVVRGARRTGVELLAAGSRISRSLVENAGVDAASPGVVLGASTQFVQTTVRGSTGTGVTVTGSGVRLMGGLVELSGGIGIDLGTLQLAAASPLRVTGGASYPVRVTLGDLARLAPTAAAQDSLLGNARDTLVVTGGSLLTTAQTVRADVPWRFEGSASFDSGSVLTVQPGAGVVAASGVRLTFRNSGRLVAVGTPAAPVRFTSTGSTSTWAGLLFQGRTGVYVGGMPRDTSRLINARIEYATQGSNAAIHSQDKHLVLIDSSVIRQSGYAAVYLGAPQSRISRSTIDTSGTQGSGSGIALGDSTFLDSVTVRKPFGAGLAISGSSVTVTGVTVTGSGQQGIVGNSGSAVRLLGGSILNAAGTGIDVAGSTLSQVTPFTVTGGASYPLRVTPAQYRLFLPDSAARATYAGNAKDTVLITSGTLASYPNLIITTAAPIRFEGSVTFDSSTVVTVRPGFVFRMASGQGFTFQGGSRLVARGTTALPIQFVPDNSANPWGTLSFQGTPSDSSYLTNVRLERGASYGYTVDAASTHPVVMDTALVRQARNSAVRLSAPGSRFSRSTIDTTGRDNSGVVTVAGIGLALGDSTKVEGGVIRNASGIGVDVNGTGVRLVNTRVLASGDVGLDATGGTIADFTGSRVVGGASYPVYAQIQALPMLIRDSLLGNARDTIRVSSGTLKRAQVTVGAALPWRVDGHLYIDSAAVLNVQPGGRVAVASGQSVLFYNGGRLVARGTAGSPVVFTAANPAQPWGGLAFQSSPADSSYLVNARVEYSGGYSGSYSYAAVAVTDQHRVVLDSTVIRQSASGLYLGAPGWRVSRSRVDTTTNVSYAAVYVNATGKWEANRVRGGASYPLQAGSVQYLTGLAPADQDSLLGNARDTLAVSGGMLKPGQVTVGAALPWRVDGHLYIDSAAVMNVQPGGRVAVASGQFVLFYNGGRLVARGTAGSPVVFAAVNPAQPWGGLVFQGSPADSSYLVNVRVEYSSGYYSAYNNAAVVTLGQHSVVLDSTVIRQSASGLYLAAPGWRVSRSRVDTTTNASYAAVYLNATGKWEANRVRGSGSYAMRTTAENLAFLTADPAYADSLLGNARDTLVVTGGTLKAATVTVVASLPWRVDGNLYIDSAAVMNVQPGGRVAVASGQSVLWFSSGGRLVARGTAGSPVVFTAVNPAQPWGGLVFQGSPADSSYLVNARVEYSSSLYGSTYNYAAVAVTDQHRVVVDSTVIRQSASGLYLAAPGWRVSRSRVDTTTNASYAAVYLNATGKWEANRVRGSGSYAMRTTAENLAFLTADPAYADSLLGNARDTLVVTGGTLKAATVTVGASLPWRVQGGLTVDSAALLVAQPGARFALNGGPYDHLVFQNGGRLSARGTAAAPVVISAGSGWGSLQFLGAPTDTSYLTNARVESIGGGARFGHYGAVLAGDQHRLALDSVVIRNSAGVYLGAPGSRISRSRVDTTTGSNPAISFGAEGKLEATSVRRSGGFGIYIGAAGVTISYCDVSGGLGDGVLVTNATGVAINNCNFENNSGAGVNNTTGTMLDATNNWWGDALGPTGPAGDGVSANVNYTPFKTSKVTIPQ